MAAFAASMQTLGASMQASAEVERRLRAEARSSQRVGIAFVFLLGAALVLGGVAAGIAGVIESAVACVPAVVLGGLGAFFLFLGVYNLRDRSRTARLRRTGLRGRATIDSYRERSSHTFQLVLHVELPSRQPYDVRTRQYVGNDWMKITTHAELPVLVSPDDPNDLIFDFDD